MNPTLGALSRMYAGGGAGATALAAAAPWAPTTQQGGLYDWSRLAYNGTSPGGTDDNGRIIPDEYFISPPTGQLGDWGSRAGVTRDPFNWSGPESWMHDPSMNDSQIANPAFDQAAYDRAKDEYEANPTFTAKRRTGAREGWNDDNKYWYENAGYKLETGPDGKQYLVQTRDWNVPGPEKSSWMQSGPDALKFLGTVLAGGALGGAFGGAGAGAGAAAPGMSGLEWGALADSAAGATSGVFGGAAPGAAAAGGVGAAAAVDPLAAYMTTGGVEGSILGGGTGGAAGAVGPGTVSAGLAEAAAGGLGSMGMSSADKAALYGPEGYGPGMTGAQTGAYDTVLGVTGSKGLADLAAGAANFPGVGKLIQNGTSAVGNWWDRFTDLDPTAWQQGLGALGALDSLFGGGGPQSGGPQLPGGTVGGFGANNDWTAAQKPQVSSFFDRPAQPRVWTPRPQGYAEGGGVMSMMAEEDGMMAPEEGMAPFDSQEQSFVEGPGGGQGDRVDASLSPGEYVFDADVVSALGDGSNEEGARRLDEMRELIRQRSRSAPPDQIPPKALPPAGYLQQVMHR